MRGKGLPKGDTCRKKGVSSFLRRFSRPKGGFGGSGQYLLFCVLAHTQAQYFTNCYFAGMTSFSVILVLTTIGCSLSYKHTSQKPSEHPGNKFLGPQEQRTGMCGWSHSDKMSLPRPHTSVSLLSSLSTTSILIFLPRITIDNFYGWFLSGCLRLFGTACGLTKWDRMDD